MWNWDYTNINNVFFMTWTPELAYVVGFFIADGSMSDYSKSGKYSVKFQCADLDVIEKIAEVSGYKNKIMVVKTKWKLGYRISMAGKFIWNFFADLGFDNNKSHNAIIPNQVPENLWPHLVRGIFDGDGSISLRKRSSMYPQLNIVGTRVVIDFISDFFDFFNTKIKHRSSVVWRLDYNGDNAVKFMNLIYSGSTIHMNRKFDIYNKCKDYKNIFVRWSDEELELIKNNYANTYAVDMIDSLDRGLASIRGKASRLGIKRHYTNGKILRMID